MTERHPGQDKIPPVKRAERLRLDGYRCQACPAKSIKVGGTAHVEVHHRDPDPEECDRHALENLTTLCADCHSWLHKKPTSEVVPLELSAADERALRPVDYLILNVFHEDGPCSLRTVQDRMAVLLSDSAVREHVYRLMGFDYEVFSRDHPLADQDAATGEWGLFEQITNSERGQIPENPRTVLQRAYDERVRRALARGCDRETVMDAFDIARRTTWYKQYRAQAYDFPLAKFEQGKSAGTAGEELTLGEPDEVWGTATDTGTENDDVIAAIRDDRSATEDTA